ncbi:MAG: hypothetical protein ABIJ56_06795 [Pseudomonadota bacterium]
MLLPAFLSVSCGWFGSNPVTVEDSTTDMDADMDGADMDMVTELEGPCTSGAQCDDGEPCNGQELCLDGECAAGDPLPDGATCITRMGVDGQCMDEQCVPLTCGDAVLDEGEECDDGNGVSGDGCDVNCEYSCHGSEECEDTSECTIDLCSSGGTGRFCEHQAVEGGCNDGLFCTTGDLCTEAGVCEGTADRCDDDVMCTADVCVEDEQVCSSVVGEGWCLIDEACYEDFDQDPDNVCLECRSVIDNRAWSPRAEGAPCPDAYTCTTEACDGSGSCIVALHDDTCVGMGEEEVCRPLCFPETAQGCGAPPAAMQLTCDPPAVGETTAACRIDLGGLEGQAGCLGCSAEVGVVLLDYTDFGDSEDHCMVNGWELVTGAECCETVSDCSPSPSPCTAVCCDDPENICRREDGTWALQLGQRRCHNIEESRLVKTFDTTGIESLTLCFDLASDNGEEGIDFVMTEVRDSSHAWQNVFCHTGMVQEDVNREYYPYCVDLPAWAGDNPEVTVRFIVHDSMDSERATYYLDDVSLRGWVRGCAPTVLTLFEENFDECPDPIPDAWNGWEVMDEVRCPGPWACGEGSGPAAYAPDDSWTLQRMVDAASADGEVVLCFSLGDFDGGSRIEMDFNAVDTGDIWEEAWYPDDNLGPDGTCRNTCVNLSDINPAVARNPNLWLRFYLDSNRTYAFGQYILDDILLTGARYCAGEGFVQLGAVSDTGGGFYDFTVTNLPGTRMSPDIFCTWGAPSPALHDSTAIDFTY